jgi:hypothetical protein
MNDFTQQLSAILSVSVFFVVLFLTIFVGKFHHNILVPFQWATYSLLLSLVVGMGLGALFQFIRSDNDKETD